MGAVAGSYESVVRGVSEQNPQSRRSGQHWEQVNMISDPVRGLARRHGSVMQDEVKVATSATTDLLLQHTISSRAFPFFVAGTEYDLVARTDAIDSDVVTAKSSALFCMNKEIRKFVPVVYDDSALVGQLITGGMSAMANVGRYIYLAGKSIVPTAIETPRWNSAANKAKLAGWVRGGAYSRLFTVRLVNPDGSRVVGTYTTKSASYPTLLDTSDIPADATDYQKQINDRTNAYNSAVTAWIGEAAQDITPANIATKLTAALIAAGVSASNVHADGAYVVVTGGGYIELEMDDDGDGSLVRAVGNVIENINLVSSRHYVGKVLRVEPDNSTGDPVYLEAFAKDDVSTGWSEVVWREAAGFENQPDSVFCMGTVENGTLYVAGSAAGLQTLTGLVDVPDFEPNRVGDAASAPLPELFGKSIDYLGVFQDRLIIGSGSTLLFSRSGDYLNWFRQSVLTIEDNDPWEGYALGAEDDTIKYSALYDRSLLLYGERFQYIVSGRQAFTPSTANIAIASSYEDAVDAAPKSAGNFVFYCKYSGAAGKEISSVHQVQPGIVTDVSDSFTASQVLDTYLAGRPAELLTLTAPNFVVFRTTKDRRKVFTYAYLDNPNTSERLFDSWSHWEWQESVGHMCGLSRHNSDILIYMLKGGQDRGDTSSTWISCERFVRETDLADLPYLDSLRPLSSYLTPGVNAYLQSYANIDAASTAVEKGVAQQFLGTPQNELDDFLGQYPTLTGNCWSGYDFPAYVTPTNPFVRDQNGQAILNGRLTIGRIKVAVTETGGMLVNVVMRNLVKETLRFTGRVLGSLDNLLGQQPIVTTDLSAMVGGEVRECRYTLSAIKWLPLTINSIEWSGQSFNRKRRVT